MSEKSLTIDEAINIIQERIDSDTKVAGDIYDKAYTMSVANEASSITSWVAGAEWALDIIKRIKWNNWHTGTPTESGWYLIKYKHIGEMRYIAMEDPSSWVFTADTTIGWQKIEPYRG